MELSNKISDFSLARQDHTLMTCIIIQDELLWAAAWLYHATNDKMYLDFLESSDDIGGVRTELSWDDKYIGAQVLIAKVIP